MGFKKWVAETSIKIAKNEERFPLSDRKVQSEWTSFTLGQTSRLRWTNAG
jgi:hypothetical protein